MITVQNQRIKLIDFIYDLLLLLMSGQKLEFNVYVQIIMPCLTIRYKDLPKFYSKLHHVVFEGDNALKKKWATRLQMLCFSCNQRMFDLDSHFIGTHYTSIMCAEKSQNLLNVKHLIVNNEIKQHNRKKIAIENLTIIYDKENIIRVKCCKNFNITTLLDLYIGSDISGYYNFENTNVYEFYFIDDKNILQRLNFFNSSNMIHSIVFYSNCKMFNAMIDKKNLQLSNMLKFYYCILNDKITFTIDSTKDLRTYNVYFMYVFMFLKCNNIKIDKNIGTSPLNIITTANPLLYISKCVNYINKFNNTDKPSTLPVYELASDREYRLLGKLMKSGKNSVTELIACGEFN